MRTNIVIDDKLLSEAFNLSHSKTKKDLIHEALEEYVISHKAKNLMDLKGKISFSESYDHKSLREGKYNTEAVEEDEYKAKTLREGKYNAEAVEEDEYKAKALREGKYNDEAIEEDEYKAKTLKEGI